MDINLTTPETSTDRPLSNELGRTVAISAAATLTGLFVTTGYKIFEGVMAARTARRMAETTVNETPDEE